MREYTEVKDAHGDVHQFCSDKHKFYSEGAVVRVYALKSRNTVASFTNYIYCKEMTVENNGQ